jgi:hypothetical protein
LTVAVIAAGGGLTTNKTITLNGVTSNLNDNPSFNIAGGTNFPYTAITNSPWATTNQIGSTVITDILLSGNLLYDAEGSNLQFEVECSTNRDFSSALKFQTTNSVSGWYYFNGSIMTPLTTNGLAAAYQDTNGLAFVQFSTNIAYSGAFVRARSWDGTDYSNYRIVTAVYGGIPTGAAGIPAISTLTYTGTNIVSDFSIAKAFRVTLTNNAYLVVPTNVTDGQIVKWWVKQGTGNNLLALASQYVLPTGTTNLSLSVLSNSVDLLIGEYNATAGKIRLTGLMLFGE